MKNSHQFYWNDKTGTATCILKTRRGTYCGIAECSVVDTDMKSEKTGQEIALRKATIEALKDVIKEYRLKLKTLNQFYYTVNKSKYFNDQDYVPRRLVLLISKIEKDIENLKAQIEYEKNSLKEYTESKDEFYKKIRKNRKHKV